MVIRKALSHQPRQDGPSLGEGDLLAALARAVEYMDDTGPAIPSSWEMVLLKRLMESSGPGNSCRQDKSAKEREHVRD